ncbi:MAG: hypothetical protein FWD28_06935 [Treponema sp.]|nr:hypothetical protein [Treponema sp.]
MKRKPDIIVMLTQNDVTVKDALDIFLSSCDLDVHCWGFKNTGINKEDMYKLAKIMKEKGKKTFLEVLAYDEASCLDIAKTAAECGIDEVMGTLYFPSVHKFLDNAQISYKPFAGKVSGIPCILESAYDKILDNAKDLIKKGITGFDLLAYRSKENGEELARRFCEELPAKICIAGSVSSFKHIDVMLDIAPWGFTIGSALFDKKFVSHGDFRENLEAVLEYMERFLN